jgi:uncharacterized membrane protein YccC
MSATATRFLAALRLAICVLTGIGLSLAFNWPKPEWAAIASVVMNLPFLGATIERGLTRLLGTAFGAIIGLWLVANFGEHQILFLVFIFFFCTWAMYMGQGPLYPYSFMLGAVTALIVALPALNAGQAAPSEVWQNALYRTLETMLGITVSMVVQSVFWPNYAGPRLRALMNGVLLTSQKLIAACFHDQLAGLRSDPALAEQARETTGLLVGSGPLFSFAQRDTSAVHRRRLAYATALDDLHGLLASVSELHLGHTPPPPGSGTDHLAPALTRLAETVQSELATLQQAWALSKFILPPPADFPAADAAFLADYELARHGDASAGELIRLIGVRTALGDIWQSLCALRLSLAAATGPVRLQENLPERLDPPPASPTAACFRYHLAIKAGLAVAIGSYLFLFINVPGGIALPVAALFFVVITVLARFQPSVPLNLGMILGSVMAGVEMYWVFPYLNSSFPLLCLALLPGLLFWGWVSGNPRYAGVGMLGCILYIYSFALTNENQTYSLIAYVDLVVGQVVGTSIATICLVVPWPLYPQREVRLHLARFWHCTHDLIQAYALDFPWSDEHTDDVRMLEYSLLVLPSKGAAWLGDLPPHRFSPSFRARLIAHLAAAQSLGMQIRALSLARQKVHAFPLYHEIGPYLQAIRAACLTDLAAFHQAFLDNVPPPPALDIVAQCRALIDFMEQLRAAGRTFVYSATELGAVLAIIARYHDVARDLLAAREALLDEDYALLGRDWFL